MRARAQANEPAPVPDPPSTAQNFPNERTISLRHHWTREELTVVYRIGNDYVPEAVAQINWLLRDYRCSKSIQMDPKLIDLLYELQEELKPRGPVRVISGYRSEGYNASLLRAGRTVDPDSQHTQGKAVDVIFPGVPTERVRAAAEARGLGGVGYYPFSGPVFVHVDTGPVRHWTEMDPKVRSAMGVFTPRRARRFALDCNLTTEQVLEQISPEQAYAALPPGAASKPRPTSDATQLPLTSGDSASNPHTSPTGSERAISASLHDGDGPACVGSNPLAALSLLPATPKPQATLKALRTRQRARKAQNQKVGRQVKSARQGAGKAKKISVENKASVNHSEKQKSLF